MKRAAIAPILLALGVTACGSSRTSGSQPPTTAPAAAPPAAPSVSATGPGDVPVIQTVAEHQPFTLSYTENNLPTTWRVTFDSIACGTAPFSPAVIRADETSTGVTYAMPTAPAGQQFCLIKFSVVNQSETNQPWMANSATLNVGMNAYSYYTSPGTSEDPAGAYMQEAQPHSQTSDFGINPGVSAVSWAVYELPADARPTSVSVPDGTSLQEYGGSQQVLVTVG